MKKLIYLDFNVFLINPQSVLLGEKEINRIKKANIDLTEGVKITFFDDDKDKSEKLNYVCDDGVLEFDKNENKWFARFQAGSDYHLKTVDEVIVYR